MQADIDSVKKSLEEAKGDVEQLKLSEAERKLENLQLKKDVLELQMKLKELHHNVISPRKNFVDVIEVTEVADNKEEVLKVVDPFSLHEETDCLLRLKKP